MLDIEEKEKHSLLFIKNDFTYRREILDSNFIENSKLASANYFIATIGDNVQEEYKETIILYCIVENLDLEELTINNIKFVGREDTVQFDVMNGINTSIVYDIDKKEYIVEIQFITNRKIFDIIKTNNYFLEIIFEHKNIYGINDKRICEINFYQCFDGKGLNEVAGPLGPNETNGKIESLAYRRNE